MTEKEQQAFDKLRKGINRIRNKTERDINSAVRKFRRACKGNKELAFSPPNLTITDPLLYLLTNRVFKL